jgi:hypothetical protein
MLLAQNLSVWEHESFKYTVILVVFFVVVFGILKLLSMAENWRALGAKDDDELLDHGGYEDPFRMDGHDDHQHDEFCGHDDFD